MSATEATAAAPAAEPSAKGVARGRRREVLLSLNVLMVAACGLIYELLCGTVASYLFGNTVLEFSLVLGSYLFAMGMGSWLSKYLEHRAERYYLLIELLLAWLGISAVPLLFALAAQGLWLRPLLYAATMSMGVLVGLELPLLVRILRARPAGQEARKYGDLIARALSFDYLGSLFAALLFPLVLVPHLGLLRTAALTGCVNLGCALSASVLLKSLHVQWFRLGCALSLVLFCIWFARGEHWLLALSE